MVRKSLFLAAVLAFAGSAASAHHSFAVFFNPDKLVTIEGEVTQFRFTNPHGTIALDVKAADGKVTPYRVETNAPVVLMRRGWSRGSMRPGDRVRIEGWASRDGRPYLRLRQAFDAQGKAIGNTAFGQSDD